MAECFRGPVPAGLPCAKFRGEHQGLANRDEVCHIPRSNPRAPDEVRRRAVTAKMLLGSHPGRSAGDRKGRTAPREPWLERRWGNPVTTERTREDNHDLAGRSIRGRRPDSAGGVRDRGDLHPAVEAAERLHRHRRIFLSFILSFIGFINYFAYTAPWNEAESHAEEHEAGASLPGEAGPQVHNPAGAVLLRCHVGQSGEPPGRQRSPCPAGTGRPPGRLHR